MSEIQLQATCFKWAWNTFPQSRYFLFSIPNEAKRTLVMAQQLKASGMIPGIPDMLFIGNGFIHAFEFKDGAKGKISPNQEKIHGIWRNSGIPVHVIRFFPEFSVLFTQIMEK